MSNPVEENWNDFWKDIVTKEDGTIDIEQVKKELYDYSQYMHETSKVYDAVTRGRVSKPNTLASAVIGEYEADINENYINKDDAKELIDNLKEELGL